MVLRCRDIPGLPGLESIRIRGGSQGQDNAVRWPYLAEDRSFKPWVKGGELVFVTGISRHRGPRELAECLYDGSDCGISGLVILTGDAYIGQLPRTLSNLADELAIPLFEQPYSLPIVDVTETIGRAIVTEEQTAGLNLSNSLVESLVAHLGEERLDELIAKHVSRQDMQSTQSIAILDAWLRCRGNQSSMAEALGCHRNTVRNRMSRLTEGRSAGADEDEYFRTLLLAHMLKR